MKLSDNQVMAIIKEPYFDAPAWIDSHIDLRDHVVLCGQASEDDVELFLIELLGYNNININQKFDKVFDDLLSQNEIAVAGGILFIGRDKKIFPSCCCGLEEWREVLECLLKKSSPWLGHDPKPVFKYIGDNVQVWTDASDNNKNSDNYYIEYNRNDLEEKLREIEKHLVEFAEGPLYNWLSRFDQGIASKMLGQFGRWFSVDTKKRA